MSTEMKWPAGPWEYSSGGIWAKSPWNARVLILEVNTFSPMNGIDSAAIGHCAKAAPALYDALAALTDWADWSFPQTEKYAEEFARETGMLAPFKDAGAVANEAEELHASRSEEWRAWLARKRAALIASARTALASARGEG